MPEKWLRAYIAMLPRLAAEEHLSAVSELTAGDAWIDRNARRDIIRGWERQMDGGGSREPEKMTEQEFRDRMAAMGLLIEEVGAGDLDHERLDHEDAKAHEVAKHEEHEAGRPGGPDA